ncbi:hypothetical protein [Streptomyces auratus]|uniref:Uncharacterized protein n=1 Tax=Streptomyces auratus AGR0001 TaxID=1160718 RepID=J1S7S1_9ACTN|nr:hypothetical protein [Streptomyces auratus]QTZ93504.1 hypothetical protein SU9_020240 [Streptomyces auratus AGR0001]
MGIESDQLVFDYLSRVGDLAQQRGLPSGTRMRLVSGLRAELDGQRPDSVSGVKRALARLGTPEAVVEAAGGAGDRTPGASGAAQGPAARTAPGDSGPAVPLGPLSGGPSQPEPSRTTARERLTGLARRSGLTGKNPLTGTYPRNDKASARGTVPGPRDGAPDSPPAVGLPPHLAGADELGDGAAPDWWRVEPGPFGPGETVPGFVGGIEIPEMWDRPESERPLSLRKDGAPAADGDEAPDADGTGAVPRGRPLPRLLRRALGRPPVPVVAPAGADEQDEVVAAPARPPLSPALTLAVLLLVAGAALGSWLALAGGWGLAYASRRLSRPEAKFAALGVPGAVVGGMVVWLWGRFEGRWGAPIAHGRLGQEMLDGLPGMVRVAAVASALFLVWRMRRVPR